MAFSLGTAAIVYDGDGDGRTVRRSVDRAVALFRTCLRIYTIFIYTSRHIFQNSDLYYIPPPRRQEFARRREKPLQVEFGCLRLNKARKDTYKQL